MSIISTKIDSRVGDDDDDDNDDDEYNNMWLW